jgi:3'-phosphoadenosine 5'-phosphosulfate sulfotransferase (PAPS reductase)/FAD synthetase
MTPLQLAGFVAHSSSAVYTRKAALLRSTAVALDPACTYVSFSAGKDSAVIAHACHAAHPSIPILMIDPGCPTHWTELERARWLAYAQAHDWNLTLYPWHKWGLPRGGGERQYRATIHAQMFGAIEARARTDGLTCRVMGIRAEESHARRMLIACRGDAYTYTDGGSAVLPVARWSTADIWAYIITHDLPWLDIYDALGPRARNGLIGRNGERFGRMEYLREHFPDAWRWAVKDLGLAGNC